MTLYVPEHPISMCTSISEDWQQAPAEDVWHLPGPIL